MQEKLEHLKGILKEFGSVLVAYSGGIDSAFLAKIAYSVLKEKAVAVTALSPSYPSYEWEEAQRVAREIGIRHLSVGTRELENPKYRANQGDRCYFCKSELYSVLKPIAVELGFNTIVNGTQSDDLQDFRPGQQAAIEQAVRSPLLEARLSKREIRENARELGLSVSEKPALACLSSRFPVGTEVTPERLERIDKIESALHQIGFRQFRVRFHEPIARIELGPAEIARLSDPDLRQKISEICHQNGFQYATIDLEGYRSRNLQMTK